MKIHVNSQDIGLGLRQESTICAIAVAMKRQMPDAKFVKVTDKEIRFTNVMTGERIIMETPTKAAKFVGAFDRGDPVAPFSFELPPPVKVYIPPKVQPSKQIEAAAKRVQRKRAGYVPTAHRVGNRRDV